MTRIVKRTTVKGVFGLPIGIKFLNREVGDMPKSIEVSTVDLEGGHLEDPMGLCAPEHGFETMVFLDGCTFFSIFTATYATRRQARDGHKATVRKILNNKLPLAISIGYYRAWEATEQKDPRSRVSRETDYGT